jgi:HEAT repeat protein
VSVISERLRRGSAPEQSRALRTLRALGLSAAPAIPELLGALQNPEATVRAAAARTLGGLGPAAHSAADAIRRAVTDADAEVRQEASEALLAILQKER